MLDANMKQALRQKAEQATATICEAAIKDCHETLTVGQYPYSHPYSEKLWYEIDAYRDRLLYLSRVR